MSDDNDAHVPTNNYNSNGWDEQNYLRTLMPPQTFNTQVHCGPKEIDVIMTAPKLGEEENLQAIYSTAYNIRQNLAS